MNELLSVVIPVYNREEIVKRCVESILAQTYNHIELIVVDDGSTDQTLSICKQIEAQNNNMIVISKPNGGVVSARKVGIARATGKYITFVDSDDWVESDAYENMMSKFQNDSIDAVTLGNYCVRSPSKKQDVFTSKKAVERLCLMEFPTSMWAYIYKTDMVKRIKLPNEVHFFEDFLFNYLLFKDIRQIAVTYDNYYHYESTSDSINRQRLNEKRMSCLKIIPYLSLDRKEVKKTFEWFSVSHFLIANITATSRKSDKTLLKKLKRSCKKYYSVIKKCSFVPSNYKKTIKLCSISVYLTAIVSDIRFIKNK